MSTQRKAGVLLPLSSLPSRHGVGDMGKSAYRYIDMLARAGARCWQILPINPLGFGNSPYQPYSSYAGDPLFISLDLLYQKGLLRRRPPAFRPKAHAVDYTEVRAHKDALLREAFARFEPDSAYEAFTRMPWVYEYAVFMAFKRTHGMRCWNEWPEAQKNWPLDRSASLTGFEADIRLEMFLQFTFHEQWMALKRYANGRGISIIGDIPIYVGIDSLDVWSGRQSFLLDAQGQPTHVAGVPPDYFSATGQRWGNPLYNWDQLQRDGFRFWVDRLRYNSTLFDIIRIDHFRAFDTYWKIPAECPTAVEGEWLEAPGYALFDTVMAELPGLRIIAEDLGMLREEVYALRDHYHFPGMNIVQFTFQPGAALHPREDPPNMAVYTGTHDNQTTAGWYQSMAPDVQIKALNSLYQAGYREPRPTARFVHYALDSAAAYAIIPVWDILGLDDRARINVPGTVGSPNWEWKLIKLSHLRRHMAAFGRMVRASGRA